MFILNRVKEDRNLSSAIKEKSINQLTINWLCKMGVITQPYQDISSHAIAAEYGCSIVLLIVSHMEFKRVKKADRHIGFKLDSECTNISG